MGRVFILPQRYEPPPDSHTQWTASRCLRLLRPISSRIEPIRRLARSEQPSRTRPVPVSSAEPVWLNPRGKKRTYARTQKPRDNSPPTSPTFQIPTPFRDPGSRPVTLDSSPIPAPTRETSRHNRAAGGSDDRNELEKGLAKGLEELLRRTAEPGSVRGRKLGAPSLVETCLMNVPEVIKGEVDWRKAQDPDCDDDVLGEIYGELEGWGPHADAGYLGLRKVVRTHGLGLVLEMVREDLLSENGLVPIGKVIDQVGVRAERVFFAKALMYAGKLQRPWLDERTGKEASYRGLVARRLDTLPTAIVGQGLSDGTITLACFAIPLWKIWLQRIPQALLRGVATSGAGFSDVLESACLGPMPESTASSHSAEDFVIQQGSYELANTVGRLGSYTLWAFQLGDWKSSEAPLLGSILATVAATVIRRTNAEGFCNIEHVESRANVAITLLWVVVALQLLAPTDDDEDDQPCIPYCSLLGTLQTWSRESPKKPTNQYLRYGESMLRCMLVYGGLSEQTDMEARLKTFIEKLLAVTEGLEEDHAFFAKDLALRLAQAFAMGSSSATSQAIVRNVELQLEEVDVLADSEECTTGRGGIQLWSLAALERMENHHSAIDDSGCSILGNKAHTPPRRVRAIDVASPDELAVSPGSHQLDSGLELEDSVNSTSPCCIDSATPDQSAVSEASVRGFPQVEIAIKPTKSGYESEEWDELLLSVKKRPVAPDSYLPTRNPINAKRARQTAPAHESDDELL